LKASQEDVYTQTYGPEVLQRLLAGFNCTIVSYGAHQTGKTYNLFGRNTDYLHSFNNNTSGFIPRLVRALFDWIVNQSTAEMDFSVSVNAFEVCGLSDGQSVMSDLLLDDVATKQPLEVLVNDETNVVDIDGLHEVFVTSEIEIFQSLKTALDKRSKGRLLFFII